MEGILLNRFGLELTCARWLHQVCPLRLLLYLLLHQRITPFLNSRPGAQLFPLFVLSFILSATPPPPGVVAQSVHARHGHSFHPAELLSAVSLALSPDV